jgi:hypothetical protein
MTLTLDDPAHGLMLVTALDALLDRIADGKPSSNDLGYQPTPAEVGKLRRLVVRQYNDHHSPE